MKKENVNLEEAQNNLNHFVNLMNDVRCGFNSLILEKINKISNDKELDILEKWEKINSISKSK